jgi:hypothetical protein
MLRLPPRRRLLILSALLNLAAFAVIAVAALAGSLDSRSAGFYAFIWIMANLFASGFTINGLFDTRLELTPEKLIFDRPTLYGRQRSLCDHWAIAGLRIKPAIDAVGAIPRAALTLDLRGGRRVHLFDALPEQHARWTAQLIGATYRMQILE